MLPAPEKPIVCYVTDRKAFGTQDALSKLRPSIHLAAASGVDWIQVREKDLPAKSLLELATFALDLGPPEKRTKNGFPRVLVNDRLDVAIAAGAHGVHLGQASLPIDDVVSWARRGIARKGFLLGVSCHRVEEARTAAAAGAGYILFGPIFDTPSKRSFGAPLGLDRLRSACQAVTIPVIAIGGGNAANGCECIMAGAAGIAAIRMFQEANDEDELREAIEGIRSAKR